MFRAFRPLIFQLDAERAHWLTVQALARAPWAAGWTGEVVDDPVTVMGLRFRNRVGLAAGMDKDGIALKGWHGLGFGFAEVGTVTPRAQPGNPKPRVFRDVGNEAIINRLGFNNGGVDACVQRVAAHRAAGMLVGINIGRNKDTRAEQAVDDYRYGFEAAYPVADYITINISSPNTPGLRDLQAEAALDALLAALAETRARLADAQSVYRPMLLKLAPDLDDAGIRSAADIALMHGIDGFIATNTTIARPPGLSSGVAGEAGGLSGPPLATQARHVLRTLRAACGPEVPLIGVGGIDGPQAARARIADGADLIQLYTGLVYHGPGLVARLARALQES